MALTESQKYELLTLDGKDIGMSRLTFFKKDNMTISTTEYVAEMIMRRIDLFDSVNDINQMKMWKITELFKNSSSETIAVRISYTENKPDWISESMLTGLLA